MNDQLSPLSTATLRAPERACSLSKPPPANRSCRHRRQLQVAVPASLLAAALLLAGSAPVGAQGKPSPADLAEKLKEIEALKARLLELEREIKAALPAPAPATAAAKPTAPPPDPAPALSDGLRDALKQSGFVSWKELMVGQSRLKFYGFLRADAIYDDSRASSTQIPVYILSEDPAIPPVIGGTRVGIARNSEDFTLHPRLTRLGVDFFGPEIAALGGAKVTGKAEIDFYNLIAGVSESRDAFRMRHAYLKLAWEDYAFLAGQTIDVISPIFPIVNPDMLMWGAGNLGDRRPQLRLEYTPELLGGRFIAQGELGLTGANDNQDLGGNGFRDGESSGKPTLQARLAYKRPLVGKYEGEVGLWAHRAWIDTETPTGASLARDFDSYAAGLDVTLPLYKNLVNLRGEIWAGQNLSDVRGGILQGINATTGREVEATGGWVELGLRPHPRFSFHAGLSVDDPNDGDLAGAAVPGRAQNVIWYLALRGYFDPIEIGLDYLNWRTKWMGFGDGRDNRFQSFISYKF